MLDWHLDPDVKAHWHRLWSVRFAVVGTAFSVGSVAFPSLLGFVNPLERPQLYGAICAAFFAVTLLSRLIDQPSLDKPDA